MQMHSTITRTVIVTNQKADVRIDQHVQSGRTEGGLFASRSGEGNFVLRGINLLWRLSEIY